VDDFLANGRTATALIDMAREAGAEVLGAGFVVEKRFKQGREHIEALQRPRIHPGPGRAPGKTGRS
jgi:xanthine phosphoribosyltransferase